MKTVVIGNSGSGKTWLAAQLAALSGAVTIHLDELFWEPGGFDQKRGADAVARLIADSKAAPSWIVEGVFGDLAQHYLDDAACLVWLDIDWPVCRARLERRGSESKRHHDRAQSALGLKKLVEWAANYTARSDLRSHFGHRQMLERFEGRRVHLRNAAQVDEFLREFQKK